MNDYPKLKEADVRGRRVLLRADFDVPLDDDQHIVDDTRIKANLPTIKHLLDHSNNLILIAKLGRPNGRDLSLSLKPVADYLATEFKDYEIKFIDDFMEQSSDIAFDDKPKIFILENIRFYSDDIRTSKEFLKTLCDLGDVFVNDAFAMAHRDEPTTTGVPQYLPSYAGFQLDSEVQSILKALLKPKRPLVSIIGGAKIATKVEPIKRLLDISDHVLVGGGVANTFLKAHGYEIGESLYDKDEVEHARTLLDYASDKPVNLEIPVDARVGSLKNPDKLSQVVSFPVVPEHGHILDIGPTTEEIYTSIIEQAQTVIWNGPMGLIEEPQFKLGTDAVYKAIIHNSNCFSIVGGGDTLAALHGKRQAYLIDHISTGGGAMLHLIEHGDLPALKALRR